MFSSLFTCDLYEIFFQLIGQYSANNANMNNNEINEMSLFLGKIKDNTECKIMNAITKQINRLLIVIQYWFILWAIAHIIINVIKMKLTYSILYIISWIFVLSGYIK